MPARSTCETPTEYEPSAAAAAGTGSTSKPDVSEPAYTFTVTALRSPSAVPATPEKVGAVLVDELPFAGCVNVTTGGVVSARTVKVVGELWPRLLDESRC